MKSLVFSYSKEYCPSCHSRLKVYRLSRRMVKSMQGEFTAVHRIRICPVEGMIFRSDILDGIISKKCTYANDIMIDAAMKRFLDGRSCSEIAGEMCNGISSRHVRNLSNQALDIFSRIHEDSVPKLHEGMESYILQIDGTTDAEFSMIVVVRDAVSDFVLYAKRCSSESQESIESVLNTVKARFGMPSGITCDMRSGIISAAQKAFPNIPVRICLMHFLRDLGKDLMADVHTDIGIMINRKGIKSPIKAMLRDMPDYDQGTLDEIGYGFCSHRKSIETMAVRRIMEGIVSTGSSGYGFPFSLRHMNFFTACEDALRKLSDISGRMEDEDARELASLLMKRLSDVTGDIAIREKAQKLRDINSIIFQRIRQAFMVPEHGNLSMDRYNPPMDDPVVHERCTIIFGELDVYLSTSIEKHMFSAAKLAVERYRNRESMLFAQNPDHTIPRTNNGMEIFFRKMRRNVRKRCGNISTGKILAQSGESLALFQNMGNPEYRKIVFGSEDISAAFAKKRKQFRKEGMTRRNMLELVAKGTEMILSSSLSESPYTGDMMVFAYSSRNDGSGSL
jgi:hypothetical protein